MLLIAALAAAEPVGTHNNPSLVSQDPLMRQILHKQLTASNGGVITSVRVGSGQTVELPPSVDPLAPLKPVVKAAVETPAKKPSLPVKKADEQLRFLSKPDGYRSWR